MGASPSEGASQHPSLAITLELKNLRKKILWAVAALDAAGIYAEVLRTGWSFVLAFVLGAAVE